MVVLLLIVYAANIYAGWEIGIFRQWPAAMTAAVAAFVPIVGPAIFLAMPTRRQHVEELPVEAPVVEEVAPVIEAAPAAVVEQVAQPSLPQPVVYPRGQFTFNRRFFETKFPGFFGVIRRDADRDMVLLIKSSRGQFIGHRISRIAANDLHLEVQKGQASEEVTISFIEIQEIQLKHKDAP